MLGVAETARGPVTTGAGTGDRKQGIAAAGDLLGAIAASSCCVVPLVLFSLGVSGVWIGNLAALAPYQPIIVVVTLGFLGYGYYLVYRKPKAAHAENQACARQSPRRTVKIALWAATVLVAAAMAFPYYAPLLLDA
jgi:mercuric ion transport protein